MQKLKDLYLNDLITMDEFKLDREKLLMQLEKINAEDSPARQGFIVFEKLFENGF
ncbi:MAG: hypothetical protein ACLTEE_17850 [Anaerobutyricum hallii]